MTRLQAPPGRGLGEAAVAQVLRDVAAGLAALHGAGVLHLDVKVTPTPRLR